MVTQGIVDGSGLLFMVSYYMDLKCDSFVLLKPAASMSEAKSSVQFRV